MKIDTFVVRSKKKEKRKKKLSKATSETRSVSYSSFLQFCPPVRFSIFINTTAGLLLKETL